MIIWTWPNALSIFRLISGCAIIFFASRHQWLVAFSLLLLGFISDGVDGWLAKILNQRSQIGAIIDPIADLTLAVGGVGGLVFAKVISWNVAYLLLVVFGIITCGLVLLKPSNRINGIANALSPIYYLVVIIALLLTYGRLALGNWLLVLVFLNGLFFLDIIKWKRHKLELWSRWLVGK